MKFKKIKENCSFVNLAIFTINFLFVIKNPFDKQKFILPPIWLLKFVLPYVEISPELSKFIWSNLSHSELRSVFYLKNSPQLNIIITSLKEKNKKNDLLVLFATFVLLSMKNKKSEVIVKYLKVIDLENKKLGLDSMRDVLQKVTHQHLIEVRKGLSILSNKELLRYAPVNFEMMALNFINDFSDIGSYLSLYPIAIDFRYNNFNDLSKKVLRRVEYVLDCSIALEDKFPALNGVKFNQYTIKTLKNTKELSRWAICLENCLNAYKDCVIKNEKIFIALLVDENVKWVVELTGSAGIAEIKGKHNIPAPEGLKEELLAILIKYPAH